MDSNTPYDSIVDLSLFKRATDVADNFQEYRITKLEWKYTPLYDTFIDASGSASLPTLYHRRQVYPTPPTFGIPYLVAQGAKPIRVDDKIIKYNYTPNVLMIGTFYNVASNAYSAQKPNYKPWLATHQNIVAGGSNVVAMDATPHQGHSLYIYQKNVVSANAPICSYEVTAHFEFRKPWDLTTITEGAPKQSPQIVLKV